MWGSLQINIIGEDRNREGTRPQTPYRNKNKNFCKILQKTPFFRVLRGGRGERPKTPKNPLFGPFLRVALSIWWIGGNFLEGNFRPPPEGVGELLLTRRRGVFRYFSTKSTNLQNFYKKFIIIFVIVSFYKNVSKVPTRSHDTTVLTDLINKFYKKFL